MAEKKGPFRLEITGAGAAEAWAALSERLAGMPGGAAVELVTDSAGTVPDLRYEMDDFDTPGFAADKMVDLLAELGAVAPENGALSAGDEEAIRRRLTDLGYLE